MNGSSRSAPELGHQAEVLRYYNETRWDYKHLWRSDDTLAIHFGYYDNHRVKA